MGTVLLWILGILLGIVLLALVIVLVLLNIRAGIEAVGVTGEVSATLRENASSISVGSASSAACSSASLGMKATTKSGATSKAFQ